MTVTYIARKSGNRRNTHQQDRQKAREARKTSLTRQIADDLLLKLAKRGHPLRQLSPRHMRKWITEKVIDPHAMKRYTDRERFAMLALGYLTGTKLVEVVEYKDSPMCSLRLTEAGEKRVEQLLESQGRSSARRAVA